MNKDVKSILILVVSGVISGYILTSMLQKRG
jgi:hypothetical protein